MVATTALILLAALPMAARSQGFAGLGGSGEGFAQVEPGASFEFPRDFAAHPDFRIEWWYVTANLAGPDGAPMGLQWTLFRQARAPEAGEGWRSNQAWMGQAALTTPDRHLAAERFGRGGFGQAGATAVPLRAWIDDWALSGPSQASLRMTARTPEFSYDVTLTADGPAVAHGENGYSVKAPSGQASYYYSQPFYRLEGTVTVAGETTPVTGQAWLDREWSSQPLAEDQIGWDWFALHLGTGDKLMAFRLRDASGGSYSRATWITPDGTPQPLPDGAATAEPLARTQVAGREVPTEWRLRLPEKALDVTVRALNPQSYMDLAFEYWEGPVTVSGSHEGVGYLEMTGY